MPNGKRRREDREIEELRRSMLPNPKNVAAVVIAALTATVIGIGLLATHGLRQSERRQKEWQRASSPTTDREGDSPFIAANARRNSPYAVARQAVSVRTGRHPEPDGPFAQGSGFLIRNGVIVTAAHVFTSIAGSENGPVFVKCDARDLPATVTAMDAVRDVAAVSVPGCIGGEIPFRYDRLDLNEGLHAAGYDFVPPTMAPRWFQTETSVVPGASPDVHRTDIEPALARRLAEARRLGVPPSFAIAGSLVPGNSGSAVFDDQGRVVGMLVVADARLNRSYCVPSSVIAEVLRGHGIPVP